MKLLLGQARKLRRVGHLSLITDDDILCAAEAVVDAAITCRHDGDETSFPDEYRRILIEELFRDPSFTVDLFGLDISRDEERSVQ